MSNNARLRNQQPVLFQKKEEMNREANNFYLKSCPANWVHLTILTLFSLQMATEN